MFRNPFGHYLDIGPVGFERDHGPQILHIGVILGAGGVLLSVEQLRILLPADMPDGEVQASVRPRLDLLECVVVVDNGQIRDERSPVAQRPIGLDVEGDHLSVRILQDVVPLLLAVFATDCTPVVDGVQRLSGHLDTVRFAQVGGDLIELE
jgi:hypothetical protein